MTPAPSRSARLIGSLTSPPPAGAEAHWADSGAAPWALEWRSDLLGEAETGKLEETGTRTVYTLRSRAEGGEGTDSASERTARLGAAAGRFDFIDMEAERDLMPEMLALVPAAKRIISWHGPAASAAELHRRAESMLAIPARYYKLVPAAEQPRDAVEPLAMLKALGRDDVVAFASGEAGTWSRLLAPRLGAPLVYAQAQDRPAAPGQLTLETLYRDYGLPDLPPISRLAGVVGRPVLHSLSPRLHNMMYRRLGLAWLYVPFHVPIFGNFWLDLVESPRLRSLGFELAGLSVTAPFKEIAMAVAGAVSPLAEHLSAANTLVHKRGVWEAESTDPEGVVGPLRERGLQLRGRRAAVVGAGGAGRAALFALASEGAETTLVNRGSQRGRRVARLLKVDFVPLDEFDPAGFDLVVNATPAGASDVPGQFSLDRLGGEAMLIDLAYRRGGPTETVRVLRESGRTVVDGREVLLHQAVSQFRAMTGEEFDLEIGRHELGLKPPEAL